MSNVKIKNNKYSDDEALKDVMEYCYGMNSDNNKCEDWGGTGVSLLSIDSAIQSMQNVKTLTDKDNGKRIAHFIINIYRFLYITDKELISSKMENEDTVCNYIGNEVSQIIYEEGYQNCYFKHVDKKFFHLHFVINTVNYKTYLKIANEYGLAQKILYYLKTNYRYLKWDKMLLDN